MKVLNKPILYVEPNCPRCREALAFFSSQGVDFEVLDVSSNNENMNAMVSVSGQAKAPTFEYKELVVADFKIDEFLAELSEFPEVGQEIGIGNSQS